MKQKRNSLCPPPSNEQGFVLALVLMLLTVILGLTMASASITLYHMKSSNAFYRINELPRSKLRGIKNFYKE
jgi:Tfp pilus assembly protein PilX